ncbi:hypothetical protein D041_0587B, partial [Vibrio parahaemolyticus EKP-008]
RQTKNQGYNFQQIIGLSNKLAMNTCSN